MHTLYQGVFAQQSDSATIVQLLVDDHATMATHDSTAHLAKVTPDYLLIEHGNIWDIEMERDSIYRNTSHSGLYARTFFTMKTVQVSGDMAYAVWHLRSVYNENGNFSMERSWNENGVFRREDGQWKIALIHSSREPKK